MLAYVLIQCQSGHENSLMRRLEDVPEIVECMMLFGEWDLLLKVEATDNLHLAGIILEHVRTAAGVVKTSTNSVVRD